jgi:hypothetical protein
VRRIDGTGAGPSLSRAEDAATAPAVMAAMAAPQDAHDAAAAAHEAPHAGQHALI